MEIILGIALIVLCIYLLWLLIKYVIWPIAKYASVFLMAAGIVVGLYLAIYDYLKAISEVFAKNVQHLRKVDLNKSKEPAYVSYFFGASYRDLFETIKTAWLNNGEQIKKQGKQIMANFAKSKVLGTFMLLFHVAIIVCIVCVGTLTTTVLSVTNIVVLLALSLIVYSLAFIFWIIDGIYRKVNGIFGACPMCGEKYNIPIYVCSNCGKEHKKLIPGKYGILKRRCQCGNKMPTMFINGRRKLEALCPNCNCNLANKMGVSESSLVCIPVIGKKSAGKTCYITSVMKDITSKVMTNQMISPKYKMEFADTTDQIRCMDMIRKFDSGITQDATSDKTPVAYKFFLKPNKGVEKEVYFYDIAGEAFGGGGVSHAMKRYEYSHGFIFVVDPLSIPAIKQQYCYSGSFSDYSVSDLSNKTALESFMTTLYNIAGKSAKDMKKVPIAVVLNKVDAFDLDKQFGRGRITYLLNQPGYENREFGELMDSEIRSFLRKSGMNDFVSLIEANFGESRFFAVSALGRPANENSNVGFKGVLSLESFEWIASKADPKFMKTFFETYRGRR